MSKTGPKQIPKQINVRRSITYFAIVVICTGLGLGQTAARFWSDPDTGLAIGGFDPLAYFTVGKEQIGSSDYEVAWRGQFWRFANEGNKAAFIDAPDTYAPQFDGYGLVSVSRGLPAIGNPLIWAIHDNRLYFFHSPQLRAVWQKNPDRIIAAARARWPEVKPATEE